MTEEESRRLALERLLDTLAAVTPRKRAAAVRTLGLRLDRRDTAFLLTLTRIWETAPDARYGMNLDGRH
jgi:hypothetical protein